jgi:hypothetical protein
MESCDTLLMVGTFPYMEPPSPEREGRSDRCGFDAYRPALSC